ncbi:hypothetical protein PENSPDRAFT_62899 [Peniophora sp. CONT]|nr:hypothetical protein PENSPDRAFT_62899 [Peniophora sp. CONT]
MRARKLPGECRTTSRTGDFIGCCRPQGPTDTKFDWVAQTPKVAFIGVLSALDNATESGEHLLVLLSVPPRRAHDRARTTQVLRILPPASILHAPRESNTRRGFKKHTTLERAELLGTRRGWARATIITCWVLCPDDKGKTKQADVARNGPKPEQRLCARFRLRCQLSKHWVGTRRNMVCLATCVRRAPAYRGALAHVSKMNFTRRVALAFKFLLGRQVASVGAGDVPGGAPALLRNAFARGGLLFEVALSSLAISSAFPRDYDC